MVPANPNKLCRHEKAVVLLTEKCKINPRHPQNSSRWQLLLVREAVLPARMAVPFLYKRQPLHLLMVALLPSPTGGGSRCESSVSVRKGRREGYGGRRRNHGPSGLPGPWPLQVRVVVRTEQTRGAITRGPRVPTGWSGLGPRGQAWSLP